ncbi:MAG: zinc-ribbon domain-containing protein [Acholeplasmatales bacterium]|nr:zinc-ribbon domain-containing protein [Acholeplasmatales bacterium]
MDKQLEFSFDSNEIVEAEKENSLYNYCITHNRQDLLDEWLIEENKISPKEVSFDSTKKFYWKCKKDGYIFSSSINARTNYYNSGCPLCANKVVLKGVNDLETLYPEVASTWDNVKNGDKKPYMYSPKSEEKFCFICPKGHSYEASINKLVKKKAFCPICAKRKIFKGYNDIFTLYPKLKKEWDNEKNTIDPYTLRPKSRKRVYLICPNGHSYQISLSSRINNSKICPYCLNQKAIPGKNDLKTLKPELVKEYSKTNRTPITDLTVNSTKRVSWVCKDCGEIYKMSVSAKVKGKKCPICKNKGDK